MPWGFAVAHDAGKKLMLLVFTDVAGAVDDLFW